MFTIALLSQRSAWQEIAQALPRGAYLLVANETQGYLRQSQLGCCASAGGWSAAY